MISKVIILISVIILGTSVAYASRPPSVSCPFKGEILDFERTNRSSEIEQYKLTLRVISHAAPATDPGWNTVEVCNNFLADTTISGTWYAPDQIYTKDQPMVDKIKVLSEGSIVQGEIDSYDHMITNITLIKAGVPVKRASNSLIIIIISALILSTIIAIGVYRTVKGRRVKSTP